MRTVLGEDSPDSLAKSLVEGSQLADPKVREQLWDGGAAAVDASRDPMIRFAKLVDDEARRMRKQYEDEVEAPVGAAAEQIAALRFKTYGTSVYPDATFTLRLNYGTIQGWNEAGKPVPPFTLPRPAVRARDRTRSVPRARQLAEGQGPARPAHAVQRSRATTTSSAATPAAR